MKKRSYRICGRAPFVPASPSALNLYIAWVLQQMIDAVSGVPGSFALSALLWFVLSVIAAIILLKTASYFFQAVLYGKSDEAIQELRIL